LKLDEITARYQLTRQGFQCLEALTLVYCPTVDN